MKKNIFLLSVLFGINSLWGQEVGINTNTPNAILEVKGNETIADPTTDAVIIPRVSHTNWKGNIVGQLIFLEKENTDKDKNTRGFYWWDGTKWTPFLSTAQTSINRTITYVKMQPEFAEGINFTDRTTPGASRTLSFDDTSLITADESNFSFDNGALIINKAGYYNVTASITLIKNGRPGVRDTFDMELLVNGEAPSAKNGNLDLKGTNSFPYGNLIELNIASTGSLKFDAGDRITIRATHSSFGNGTNNETIHAISPDSESNMILQYLGDF